MLVVQCVWCRDENSVGPYRAQEFAPVGVCGYAGEAFDLLLDGRDSLVRWVSEAHDVNLQRFEEPSQMASSVVSCADYTQFYQRERSFCGGLGGGESTSI